MSLSTDRGADLSPCGAYRYRLWRQWAPLLADPREGERVGRVAFVMLNPSTADAQLDDPTLRRCVGFARAWGYAALEVVNLYPYRATRPRDLWAAPEAIRLGDRVQAEAVLQQAAARSHHVVCAWGSFAGAGKRVREDALARTAEVAAQLRRVHATLYHLGRTGQGQPRHPLYAPGSLTPQPWEAP